MRAFLIAGEASGDRLGGALMAGLRQLAPRVSFDGIGGPTMQREGLISRFDMNELSVMGIAEILPKYRRLRQRLVETARAVLDSRPDVLITIDSPDFCLRVARRVRRAAPEIRIVHYVAPSVWAWRPGRAAKMAGCVDQVLALLPFEPPLMEAAGMRCDFVGHPVVAEPRASPAQVHAFRAGHGLQGASVLLLLPGSRQGEVKRLAPVFGQVLERLIRARPDLRPVVPAAPGVAGIVAEAVRAWPGDPIVLDPRALPAELAEARKRQAFAAADLALAASGTVSLELCAARTPMVVAYDMSWPSWKIMSALARVDTITLANLITGTRTIPEFLGPRCRAGPIAGALERLLSDRTARAEQIKVMERSMRALGQGGAAPGLRAARAVLEGLARRPARG